MIRKAEGKDLCRIAEILVFNNRLNFYPIFNDIEFSFDTMRVDKVMEEYRKEALLSRVWVCEDVVVRGLIQINGTEVEKLYVDPVFQSEGIGGKLLTFAVEEHAADRLWALEKNSGALRFYERFGFSPTGNRKLEEGTTEYLIELRKK